MKVTTVTLAITMSRVTNATTLAAASSGIVTAILVFYRTKTWNMLSICNGILAGEDSHNLRVKCYVFFQDAILSNIWSLSGLVAITAGCAVVEPWAAIICGIVAAPCSVYGEVLLDRLKVIIIIVQVILKQIRYTYNARLKFHKSPCSHWQYFHVNYVNTQVSHEVNNVSSLYACRSMTLPVPSLSTASRVSGACCSWGCLPRRTTSYRFTTSQRGGTWWVSFTVGTDSCCSVSSLPYWRLSVGRWVLSLVCFYIIYRDWTFNFLRLPLPSPFVISI